MRKLRNKKTGEIGKPRIQHQEIYIDTENCETYCYKTLDDVIEEWEDYEDPKGYWYYDTLDNWVEVNSDPTNSELEKDKAIGNYFETREEAKKAVEKLKAWKRLKDKGFRFVQYYNDDEYCKYKPAEEYEGMYDDLDLIFGGEE